MRWCLEHGAGCGPATSTPSPTPTTPRSRRRPGRARVTDDEWEGLRTLYARAGAAVPRARRCPGSTPSACASCPTTWPTPPRPTSPRRSARRRARGRRARRARLAPGRPLARDGRARGARRPGAAALARPALRGGHRAPRLPALLRRVQGDGAGLLRAARASSTRFREQRARRPATAASRSSRSTRRRLRRGSGAGEAWATGPRRPRRRACSAGSRRCCSSWPAGSHERTGDARLTMAGGVALNCVANSRLLAEGPFEDVWVQPAAGDAGTALGAALHVAQRARRRRAARCHGAPSGAEWGDARAGGVAATRAACPTSGRPTSADAVAEVLAADGVVAWFQGRSEYGPRALGHRSLLADPRGHAQPRAPQRHQGPRAVPAGGARWCCSSAPGEIFEGPLPSPYMLFTHGVRPGGASASRPSSTWTARRASRRSTAATSRSWRRCSRPSSGAPACPWWSTRASTPPGGRWSTTRATRSSASARRRSTPSPSGPSSCAGRRGRGAARGSAGRRRVTTSTSSCRPSGRPSLARAARGARGARRARCPGGSSWSTTAGGRRAAPPLAAPGRLAGRVEVLPRPGRRARRGAQRGLAGVARPSGSPSSTTTSCPAPDWLERLDADLAGARARRGRRAGPRSRAAAARPPAHRLGAQRGRPGRRALGHRRHGLPPGRPARRSAASTSASRAPTARTPTSALRALRGGLAPRGRADAQVAPSRAPRRPARQRSAPGRQRRRRARCAPSTGAAGARRPARRAGPAARHLAVTGARHGGPGGPRRRRRRRLGRAAGRRLGARHGRARLGAHRARPAHAAARWPPWSRRARPSRRSPRRGWLWGVSSARPAPAPSCAPRRAARRPAPAAPEAVLLDRDGTLIVDVPYNGDPGAWSSPCRARAQALDRLRGGRRAPRRGLQPERGGPRPAHPRRRRARSTPASRSCSARSGRGRSAPTARTTAAAAASPHPASCCARPPSSASTPRRCVVIGDIGADVEAARAAGARGVLVPTPAHPARGGRGRARGGARPCPRRSSCCWAGARDGRTCSSPASTTTATCCWPGRPCGRWRPGRGGVTLLCGPRGRAAAELLPGVDEVSSSAPRGSIPSPSRSTRAAIARARRPPRARAASTRRSCSAPSTRARCPSRCSCGWPACRGWRRRASTTPARCSTCAT